MKKVICVLVIIGVLFAGTALAKNYIYGKRYGTIKWTGLTLDHTYHCANNGSKTYCWSWTGGQSGGYYLSYTWGCRFVYLINGVCHQEANRGLYTSGKTVYKAAGYGASKAAFGTYGSGGTWSACKTACWLWW